MKITIRPDPDCIELIRSEFKDKVIDFLKSLGISENDAENWEAPHNVEINEHAPPMVDVFDMKCYLPEELFAKTEWVFKFAKEEFFISFIISGYAICCDLLDIEGLKHSPKNILNLSCVGYDEETLNEHFQELKNLLSLRSISFNNCTKLKDISLLKNLVNLQSLDLGNCRSLTDISNLAGLLNLERINLSDCELLTDISSLSGLLNLKALNLESCRSLADISGLTRLVYLQSLDLGNCSELVDISSLIGLVNLQVLDLHFCGSLTHISNLSALRNLRSIDLYDCRALTNINGLSELLNLQTLNLGWCNSLVDISCLSKLLNLQTLGLDNCVSLTNISVISGLKNLQTLKLGFCKSLTDIQFFFDLRTLSELFNLKLLDLSGYKSLTDTSSLSGLVNLQTLKLSSCGSLTDISSLSGLLNLRSLDFSWCGSLTDICSLSGLLNLQTLDLSWCKSLTDIRSLYGLLNLQTLDIKGFKRIQNYFFLRNYLALKDFNDSKMHPVELSELLCFHAVQRKDIIFISQNAYLWLRELKLGLDQKHSCTHDLACSLAQGIVLANLEELGVKFHQTLIDNKNTSAVPWKIWLSENLKTFGWDKIQKLVELNQSSELTFGAIGGLSSCLPFMESAPVQIAWAKKWISEIHSLHNNNPNFLKPAAAEWCLALKRLNENNLLREWIEKFTDPSDPSALDPINKVFSAYALDLNDCESALEYALKINDPKLRDESILNLALQFIKASETSKAGEFLFLLTQIESRTQLAYSLAEDTTYLKSDENAHRLLAACGDNPQSLASIFNKLRIANLDSKILKIMNEKLSGQSRSQISGSLIMQESNSLTNTLLKIKDSSQLVKIRQAIDSVMKSS